MKTAVMKLSAIIVLACAGVILADTLRIPAARAIVAAAQSDVRRAIDGRVGIEWFTVVLCLVVMAVAFWSLLPRFWLPRRVVRVPGGEGPITVDLWPVRRALGRVAKRLPAVRRARVRVRPVDGGNAALISADLVLRVPARDTAPAVAGRVAAQLRRAAEDLLGPGAHVRVETRVSGLQVAPDTLAARVGREAPAADAPPAATGAGRAVDPRLEPLDTADVAPAAMDADTDPAARAALRASVALLEELETAPAGAAGPAAPMHTGADGDNDDDPPREPRAAQA